MNACTTKLTRALFSARCPHPRPLSQRERGGWLLLVRFVEFVPGHGILEVWLMVNGQRSMVDWLAQAGLPGRAGQPSAGIPSMNISGVNIVATRVRLFAFSVPKPRR